MVNRQILKIGFAELLSGIGTGLSLLSIPYYILQKSEDGAFLGASVVISTLILMMLSPVLGVLIDRTSRRNFLISVQVLSCVLVAVGLVVSIYSAETQLYVLAFIHFVSLAHYAAHFSARSAYGQSILKKSEYTRFNGIMEVSNQSATLIGCIIGATVLSQLHLHSILLIDLVTYIIAGILFFTCPQDSSVESAQNSSTSYKDLFVFLRKNPSLFLILFVGYLPFLGVMIQNYVSPVHIVQTLGGAIPLISTQNLIYAIGAIAAGLVSFKLISKWDKYSALKLSLFLFFLLYSAAFISRNVTIFLVLMSGIGFANAFIRVCRSSIIMERTPKSLIGKLNSGFNTLGFLVRAAMIGFSATLIDQFGTIQSLTPYLGLFFLGQIYLHLFLKQERNA